VTRLHPVERLRQIWTPDREVHEITANLDPGTELDSMVRDLLHRIIEQKGPVTVKLTQGDQAILNTGNLRWEVVTHELMPGITGHREVSLWIEEDE
jgi:hypothetical protein